MAIYFRKLKKKEIYQKFIEQIFNNYSERLCLFCLFYIKSNTKIYKLISKILEEVKYYKEIMQKRFKKELIMTEQNEKSCQMTNRYHICKQLSTEEMSEYEITVI